MIKTYPPSYSKLVDKYKGRFNIMKKLQNSVKKLWYLYLVELLLFIQALVFIIYRDDSYIAIHDNLDLFVAHFKVMKLQNAFFAHDVTLPIVGGLDRDVFGSEFLLYNILYYVFEPLEAYFAGYALKILVGLVSFNILAKDIYGRDYARYRPLALVIGTAYGMIPVFPTYGLAFTSLPWLIYILRRLYYENEVKKRLLYGILLFVYPVLSYFSYHGFFILCYMSVAVIILWIRDRRFPLSLFSGIIILSAGYMTFEYRLFKAMLFSDTVTIRSSMVSASLTPLEVIKLAFDGFINSQFHCQDSHLYVILPISLIAIVFINAKYVLKKEYGQILKDPLNLVLGWIILNSLIYGLYDYEPARTLVETLVPKLKGFQFDRTIYFNAFLWYALLFLICKRLYDTSLKAWVAIANVIAVFAAVIVMLEPQVYNDFYYTCYNQAYMLVKNRDTSTLSYREFYSEDLFAQLKRDIGYDNEWSVAYGMHPAVLEYNGIYTLDGYIGMYTEEYKEKWREVIKPALDRSPEFKSYFDEWGPRAYIFSGNGENTYAPLRNMEPEDHNLYIDADALKGLGCRYIFSRIELDNARDLGLSLHGKYEDESSPYVIFLYEL